MTSKKRVIGVVLSEANYKYWTELAFEKGYPFANLLNQALTFAMGENFGHDLPDYETASIRKARETVAAWEARKNKAVKKPAAKAAAVVAAPKPQVVTSIPTSVEKKKRGRPKKVVEQSFAV